MPWKMSVGKAQTPDPRNRDINRKNFILSAFFDMRRYCTSHLRNPPAITHQEIAPASMGDLVPSLLKLRKQGDLALLQRTAPHHPPEISLRRPTARIPAVSIIDGQHIFRRSRLYHQDDVGVLSAVHHCEFAPLLDCILDETNGGAV